MVRPLKDLLLEADKYLSSDRPLAKEASSLGGFSSEIASLAGSCMSASEVISNGALPYPSSDEDAEYEKLAMALNRIHSATYLGELQKTAAFVERAEQLGYSSFQIDEALTKISAKNVKQLLPVLVASGTFAGRAETAANKKLPAKGLPNKDKLKDASKAVGE